jgi:hypothetical protein
MRSLLLVLLDRAPQEHPAGRDGARRAAVEVSAWKNNSGDGEPMASRPSATNAPQEPFCAAS